MPPFCAADTAHTRPPEHPQLTRFRRLYSAVVNSTAKRNYRPDLRQDAVARASAIRKAAKPVKASPASKLRGAKALKAAEASASA